MRDNQMIVKVQIDKVLMSFGFKNNLDALKETLKLIKEEAELLKKLDVEIRRGEKLKTTEKNCDENVMRMLNDNFTGHGLEDLKSFHDKLAESQGMFNLVTLSLVSWRGHGTKAFPMSDCDMGHKYDSEHEGHT
ncbi:hypothetical protein EJB05_30451 [Eragrostis curvula]|uniref:Uncharacterized protein n=1 Tax=Eragrostis curvula TaxID=38414 RepID=A0A5J9UCA0_9POAL|nr:hypothetical protein EJB05_30451 [Eragrostis curvula]